MANTEHKRYLSRAKNTMEKLSSLDKSLTSAFTRPPHENSLKYMGSGAAPRSPPSPSRWRLKQNLPWEKNRLLIEEKTQIRLKLDNVVRENSKLKKIVKLLRAESEKLAHDGRNLQARLSGEMRNLELKSKSQ